MRNIRIQLEKEFRQIFRNRSLLPLIFLMPIIQLIILPLAANYEIKNLHLDIVDYDGSSSSRALIKKITASGYFSTSGYGQSYEEAQSRLERERSDVILEIPAGFEKNIFRENPQHVFIAVNAINGIKAGLCAQYLNAIISKFGSQMEARTSSNMEQSVKPVLQLATINRFNPLQRYSSFMVPGILVTLVTMVGVYLCSLNIVKEKEIGTIEQINVTPIRKYQFIAGKIIPFWIIGMFIFSVGLFGVGRIVYGIIPEGQIWLLYAYLAVFLFSVLGIGLLISTYSNTQQQAMSLAFFVMMISIMMSGLFTPIESMPSWGIWIAKLSPVTHFIEVMRMVVLKGSGWADVRQPFYLTLIFALIFNTWAIFNYRKQG